MEKVQKSFESYLSDTVQIIDEFNKLKAEIDSFLIKKNVASFVSNAAKLGGAVSLIVPSITAASGPPNFPTMCLIAGGYASHLTTESVNHYKMEITYSTKIKALIERFYEVLAPIEVDLLKEIEKFIKSNDTKHRDAESANFNASKTIISKIMKNLENINATASKTGSIELVSELKVLSLKRQTCDSLISVIKTTGGPIVAVIGILESVNKMLPAVESILKSPASPTVFTTTVGICKFLFTIIALIEIVNTLHNCFCRPVKVEEIEEMAKKMGSIKKHYQQILEQSRDVEKN